MSNVHGMLVINDPRVISEKQFVSGCSGGSRCAQMIILSVIGILSDNAAFILLTELNGLQGVQSVKHGILN